MSDWGYKHKEHEQVNYEDIDFTDRQQVIAARNSMLREQWIKTMEQRLVRDELAKCYKSEGVNHYVNCKHLAERYFAMLKEHKHVTGYSYHEEDRSLTLVSPKGRYRTNEAWHTLTLQIILSVYKRSELCRGHFSMFREPSSRP